MAANVKQRPEWLNVALVGCVFVSLAAVVFGAFLLDLDGAYERLFAAIVLIAFGFRCIFSALKLLMESRRRSEGNRDR